MKYCYLTIGILACLSTWSCDQEQVIPSINDGQGWEINADQYVTATTQSTGDPFLIRKVVLADSLLKITVQYAGGCEKHDFKLVWDGQIDYSTMPAQVTFALIHDGNNDGCDALPTEELVFDLFEVMKGNRPIEGFNAWLVNASTNESIPAIPASINYGWAVEFTPVLCGDGLWSNLWLQTLRNEQAGGVRSFLLQPIRTSAGVELPEKVEEGDKYYIGATIIDDYEPNPDIAICQAYPGNHYSIEITCLQRYE